MISRRDFFSRLIGGLGLMTAVPVMTACDPKTIRGSIVGANAALGHRLRSMSFGPVSETINVDAAIVGGGVAGLSAARFLKKRGTDFILLEMEERPGGNAIGGGNSVSAYPWGAHYLPLPGNGDGELLEFLNECGAITGRRHGLPVFNDYYLCHDPKERLFINHFWQDGIIPREGVPKKERDEIQRFLDLMNGYRDAVGSDGKKAFTLPVSDSSNDKRFRLFDMITADEFLLQQGFSSTYLKWYVNYCCADDYGTSTAHCSAWAMIHYFASRNGVAANAASDAVLTWSEGNQWLTNKLKEMIPDNIHPNSMVLNVTMTGAGVEIFYFSVKTDSVCKVIAKAVIIATPQFVNARILKGIDRSVTYEKLRYSVWMVANVTTDHPLTEGRGEGLSWDNVIYGSEGLGYINANHQNVAIPKGEKVITYYRPLLGDDAAERRSAFNAKYTHWSDIVLQDLKKAHPVIDRHVQQMDIWVWGHGMIKPFPGLISGQDLKNAERSIDRKIYFAHSDLSGISIFEEAFYRGHCAAKQLIENV